MILARLREASKIKLWTQYLRCKLSEIPTDLLELTWHFLFQLTDEIFPFSDIPSSPVWSKSVYQIASVERFGRHFLVPYTCDLPTLGCTRRYLTTIKTGRRPVWMISRRIFIEVFRSILHIRVRCGILILCCECYLFTKIFEDRDRNFKKSLNCLLLE